LSRRQHSRPQSIGEAKKPGSPAGGVELGGLLDDIPSAFAALSSTFLARRIRISGASAGHLRIRQIHKEVPARTTCSRTSQRGRAKGRTQSSFTSRALVRPRTWLPGSRPKAECRMADFSLHAITLGRAHRRPPLRRHPSRVDGGERFRAMCRVLGLVAQTFWQGSSQMPPSLAR
jgi:hypothetical protein